MSKKDAHKKPEEEKPATKASLLRMEADGQEAFVQIVAQNQGRLACLTNKGRLFQARQEEDANWTHWTQLVIPDFDKWDWYLGVPERFPESA